MGVDRTDYLVLGWKLNTDLLKHPSFDLDRVYDRAPDEFIYDSMTGEYAVFGRIILEVSDETEGFTFNELEPADLVLSEDEISILRELFREMTFGLELNDWIEGPKEPRALLFSHFW
jgi:hypothetical protein